MGFIVSWGMIAGVSVLYVLFPNIATLLLLLWIFSNRQMGLGVLLHECAHRSWFRTPWLNDVAGHWFAGMWVLVPLPFYRKYHFIHHTRTGTLDDPDLDNIKSYPVTRQSFRRKMWRDFTGRSGLKSFIGLMLYVNTGRPGNAISMGVQKQEVSREEVVHATLVNYSQLLLVHGSAAMLLGYFGHLELLLWWWVAFLFGYPFILRIRQIAEHAAMPALASEDVRDTTRTTIARWWERLIFAPHGVNYHCEHHALPTVPGYHLPRMHQLLKQRGFYQHHPDALVNGYPDVIRKAMSA
ncbi:hypothetical protein BTA51_07160 [Hahella sp. CCB-MM4]|nr:hypothetical protein BTA51_07160 [Hahella sp. CCB-MM4]